MVGRDANELGTTNVKTKVLSLLPQNNILPSRDWAPSLLSIQTDSKDR